MKILAWKCQMHLIFTFVFALVCIFATDAGAQESEQVTIYSYRQPFLIKPLLEAFEEEMGIKTNVLFAKAGLLERVEIEGINSPADVILTVDIGRLTQAVEQGITQAVSSPLLEAGIPAVYRDPEGHWFGLTRRARVAYVSRERVEEDTLTYESLADSQWRGRICTRDGQHAYNIALFAAFLLHHGKEKTRSWMEGLKANLARSPVGNDRDQIKAVYAGECDLAIGNTYYFGIMQSNEEKPQQKEWARSVRILFPVFENGGTHVNLSGMVMAKYAPNAENALKLMEFLSGEKAQQLYARLNYEYPVGETVPWSERTLSWGTFNPDALSLEEIAASRKAASLLVDEVAYNE